jgi:hypothetical protein
MELLSLVSDMFILVHSLCHSPYDNNQPSARDVLIFSTAVFATQTMLLFDTNDSESRIDRVTTFIPASKTEESLLIARAKFPVTHVPAALNRVEVTRKAHDGIQDNSLNTSRNRCCDHASDRSPIARATRTGNKIMLKQKTPTLSTICPGQLNIRCIPREALFAKLLAAISNKCTSCSVDLA